VERSESERGLEAGENREPEGGLLLAVILEMLAEVLSERLGILAIDQHTRSGSLQLLERSSVGRVYLIDGALHRVQHLSVGIWREGTEHEKEGERGRPPRGGHERESSGEQQGGRGEREPEEKGLEL